ncbi:armadillo-type protein [Fomitopsis serialis]|uniref:armadillo-type protein n=1 Tax=Fomitopsis serialis TaxID=139415 RepID=UPI00200783FD|nr:armadillo-type protein [Neoantrodia serialis]KAH9915889.1 armadillo-type protein [Neoantrodia serialis]
MGKSDIQSWLASTSDAPGDSDPNGDANNGMQWRRDYVVTDWAKALEVARSRLLTSSTKARTQFLREELLMMAKHGDLSLSQILDIFKLLTLTYSREAVETVGSELVRRDEMRGKPEGEPEESPLGVTEQIVGWLAHEVGHISKLSSDPAFTSKPAWEPLVGVMATLIDMILDKATRSKSSLQKGALTRHPRTIAKVMQTLMSKPKTSPSPLSTVPLLGICVDVKIRLKNVKDDSLKTVDSALKADVLNFYGSTVLMSKTQVAPHTTSALHDFIQTFVTVEDFGTAILPTMDKALLRSPEISLAVVTDFVKAYPHAIEGDSFRRLLTPVLNSARSSNATVRLNATLLFKAIIEETQQASDIDLAVNELLALPKASKTAGPDHRVALYTMLGYVKPSPSAAILESGLPLLAKETHDAAVSALSSSLAPHLGHCLREDVAIPAGATSVLVREANSSKPAIRRAFCILVARYTATAVLLGPFAASGKFDDFISRNSTLQSMLTAGAKPSFLLWEKVYQKLSSADDERWLLRASEATLAHFSKELLRNEQACGMIGMIFLHLASNSQHSQVRRMTLASLEASAAKLPEAVNCIATSALSTYLLKGRSSSLRDSVEENDVHSRLGDRLAAFCLASVTSSEACDEQVRKSALVSRRHVDRLLSWVEANLQPGGTSRLLWIELCQKSRVDPHELITERLNEILRETLNVADAQLKLDEEYASASYHAITTAAFVAPDAVLSRVVEQLKGDFDVNELNSLSETDLAIWATPEGQTYVDVLSSKKIEEPVKKGKGYKDAQWEAEVRKSLANKKGSTSTTLSKQDQALVEAQLEKEKQIRKRVSSIKARLERGLKLGLAQACSDRLEIYRSQIGVATLRSLGVEGVPEDFQLEPLNSLVIRVLYRLRTLSEQSPFDAATFSYASPLLSAVCTTGGVALAEGDDPLEQVALAVDIIRFHAGESLIDIGQSMHSTATLDEIQTLLRGTLQQEVYVRNACLQTLQPFDLTDLDWSPEIWIACHDDDEQNARLARHVWEDNGMDVPEKFVQVMLTFLEHEHAYVRASAAAALSEAVTEQWPQMISEVLNALQEYYRETAKVLAPEFDEYGMVIAQSLDRSDPWPTRIAIARAFEFLAPAFGDGDVDPFFKFLIQNEALGDRHADVRRCMLNAGTAVIDLHGQTHLPGLIAMFEAQLSGNTPATEAADQIKEATVILFGRVARHLDPSDKRMPQIVERLIEALKTPAEQVQIAVSDCLAPLVKVMQSPVPDLVDRLLHDLFNAPKYAARRGAAYGLAGVVKGAGITAMKEFNILDRLKSAAEDKKQYEARQGPCLRWRRSLPHWAGFSNLAHEEGSIELLGMIAYCAPRQLSQSLPIVIPRLTDVLTDSHTQVRTAANKSLKQFGEVISNPEIQSLVPVFLKAMVDPSRTPNALSSLLKTSFLHYIDHSSLALVVPIIDRGLRERSADTKRKAAQIVGNLASLTDSKDFVPYLGQLLPMVHVVLVDPVPEARATAAKALGTLVERLGEVHFPDLVPGLLRTLKTDTSGVDRQGAAQGLSEVLAGLGMERMEGLLPDIIANAQSPRSTVREGFMSLLVFLPATFGTRFQPHLPKIIPPILSGLSDSEDYVRDAAMRAGRMMVTNYSSKAIDLLLPELERGCLTLDGVSGGKAEIEEDEEATDTAMVESSRRALVDVLGAERRDRILSALYLARQDAVNVVRQSSIHIWKALVHNTPRTVREILPELINQVISLLAGPEMDQQETAARTVAELCRKSGEKILGEIVSILKSKSTSTDPKTREGVCLTLCELMESTNDTQREDHEDDIISMVRAALVDDEANVRAAAAKAFDTLQEHIGAKAIDQTIPTLLEALRQPGQSSGTALQALREVMAVRASTVFPVLIPTLTAIPMTVFNARALAALVTVAGTALSKRLTVILNALAKMRENPEVSEQEELTDAISEATRALLASICDAEGLNTLMLLLLGWAKHESVQRRITACELFALFCEESELDSSLYRVDWIRQLVSLLDDNVVAVHTAALRSFDIFVKSVPKDELEPLVVPLRRTIEGTGAPGRHVPGFSLPKGVAPTVPIIIAGLTTGSNEQREQAAYAMATTYPPGVKIAILTALSTMLERIPTFVKPFFPQLQRTFVKSASDPASLAVRNKAAEALGMLMRSQPRVDPVITELVTGAKSSDDAIAGSLVLALARVVKNAGSNIGEKARETPIIEANMVAGTPPSALSSVCILAVVAPDEDDQPDKDQPNVFQTLGLMHSVAQKCSGIRRTLYLHDIYARTTVTAIVQHESKKSSSTPFQSFRSTAQPEACKITESDCPSGTFADQLRAPPVIVTLMPAACTMNSISSC